MIATVPHAMPIKCAGAPQKAGHIHIVHAEFVYDGKLSPNSPAWLIDGIKPSRLSSILKDRILPPAYSHGMLKGREWMVTLHMIDAGR